MDRYNKEEVYDFAYWGAIRNLRKTIIIAERMTRNVKKGTGGMQENEKTAEIKGVDLELPVVFSK